MVTTNLTEMFVVYIKPASCFAGFFLDIGQHLVIIPNVQSNNGV
jgi:hypothetical protein